MRKLRRKRRLASLRKIKHDYIGETSAGWLCSSPCREYRNADNSQAPLIRFEKRVDNTYYVVEAVPDSKANRMAVVSAYMETVKKEASSPKSVDAAEAAPRATPEASLEISETSDNSIPNAEENVNRGQAENSAN